MGSFIILVKLKREIHTNLAYLKWTSFCVDKISSFREFWGPFAKINPREYFEKCPFAKLNPRKVHTKILSKTLKFEIADSKGSLKWLVLSEVVAKYPTKPILLHLKLFDLIRVLL